VRERKRERERGFLHQGAVSFEELQSVQEEFQSEKEELQSDAADPQHAAAQESWCKLSTSNLTM
jgi:hypothetical protein